ncbi:MAG: hypothetical protein IJT36_00165 [Alphaproteobacteria bacterium]|nr:hypothetical protein [Alphaproteobacteria bacterium]
MYKRIMFASFIVGIVCFDNIFSTDNPLKNPTDSSSEERQKYKKELTEIDNSHITETESFYANAGISVDLTTQNKGQDTKSSDIADTKKSSEPDETGSVWSISDLESVATHMPEPPSRQTQKNPSSTSTESSSDTQNKQNPDETGSILSMSDLESVASRIPTSRQTQENSTTQN